MSMKWDDFERYAIQALVFFMYMYIVRGMDEVVFPLQWTAGAVIFWVCWDKVENWWTARREAKSRSRDEAEGPDKQD